MRATVKWYSAVLAILCLSGVARPGNDEVIDPTWLTKTREGAKATYEKFKALSTHLEEECEYRSDKVPGGEGTVPFRAHTRRERVIYLGDNVLCEQVRILDDASKQPQIRLQCDNNDYHFTLSKSQEDAPYALVEYAPGKRKIPLIQQEPGLYNEAFAQLQNVLAAIEDDRKHTLQKLRFDDAKGVLLIEYTHTMGDGAQNQIYIDPSHDWRVVERRVETPSVLATSRYSYGITVGGLEFPTECKNLMMYKVAKAPPNMEITARLISLKITDKKPEDFRLSAFDLPEPVDVAPLPKPTRWYLWILAAAVASAALAMLFAWLKRRHTRTASLPSKAS
jgi:hypothetical protein